MNEQIKNPNQLDLFEGIVLTPEQEKLKKEGIDRVNNNVTYLKKANERHEMLLREAGFVEGKDYINTFKVTEVTDEMNFGYDWKGNSFKTVATYLRSEGDISLKGVKMNSETFEIEECLYNVWYEDGKFQCSTIQDQYRYIKASTLLNKLKDHIEILKGRSEYQVKRKQIQEYTINKYQTKYPNAKVTIETEWRRYSGEMKYLKVEFPSGSYVNFQLSNEIDKEVVIKIHDEVTRKLSTEEILNMFSNQVNKEVSN